MKSINLKPGNRIKTPSMGEGTILKPLWAMPCHHLIALTGGGKVWILIELLTLIAPAIDHQIEPAAITPKTRQAKRKTTGTIDLAKVG